MNKILLIEDDKVLRENTAEILELSDYEVHTASNGRQGVKRAMELLPDLIICDIMMPELDGYGVLNELSRNEQTRTIPFIFLSAKTEHRDIRKGMELGADDYLTKPYEEVELIGAIESRLAKVAILRERSANATTPESERADAVSTIHQLKNFIDDNGKELTFKAGENIYEDGSISATVYLLLSGVVKTHKLDRNGKELITGVYKADDYFGFHSFAKSTTHQEAATALEDTTVITIPTAQLTRLLSENQDLALELMQQLSENLDQAKEQLLEMAYGSVRKKTARTILKFAERLDTDEQGNIHILRSDLASVAGMATETLIRTLSDFKKEGLIKIEGRNIKILELNKLRMVN